MKLTTFLRQTNVESSLLIGYYGGGNYGDELLLEVLQNLLKARGVRDVAIAYQEPETYHTMHHDLGYEVVDARNKKALTRSALKSKTILVGGGGLWGVDMNVNTLLLSIFLFICRFFLGKKVHLLGIGYYKSTTRMGHIGAWFAGKAANTILARDQESYDNFGVISSRVYLDADIAWYIGQLDLRAYEPDVLQLNKKLPVYGQTLFVAPRRLQAKKQQADFSRFNDLLGEFLAQNSHKHAILALAESEAKAPELHTWARSLQATNKELRLLDFACNPLALFLFFRTHGNRLAVVAPQLHIIVTAYLTGAAFMPLVYDNKVSALLKRIGVNEDTQQPLHDVTLADMQGFVDGAPAVRHSAWTETPDKSGAAQQELNAVEGEA